MVLDLGASGQIAVVYLSSEGWKEEGGRGVVGIARCPRVLSMAVGGQGCLHVSRRTWRSADISYCYLCYYFPSIKAAVFIDGEALVTLCYNYPFSWLPHRAVSSWRAFGCLGISITQHST